MSILLDEIERGLPSLEKIFKREIIEEFSKDKYGNLWRYNNGMGSVIRFKLMPIDGKLFKEFIKNGFNDVDTMTLEILREFYKYLNRKER